MDKCIDHENTKNRTCHILVFIYISQQKKLKKKKKAVCNKKTNLVNNNKIIMLYSSHFYNMDKNKISKKNKIFSVSNVSISCVGLFEV